MPNSPCIVGLDCHPQPQEYPCAFILWSLKELWKDTVCMPFFRILLPHVGQISSKSNNSLHCSGKYASWIFCMILTCSSCLKPTSYMFLGLFTLISLIKDLLIITPFSTCLTIISKFIFLTIKLLFSIVISKANFYLLLNKIFKLPFDSFLKS